MYQRLAAAAGARHLSRWPTTNRFPKPATFPNVVTAKVHRWSLETRIQTFLEAKAKDARQSSRRPPNQVALALVAAGNPDASIDRARLKFDVEVNPDIRLALSRSSASEHTEQSLPSVTMSGRQTT